MKTTRPRQAARVAEASSSPIVVRCEKSAIDPAWDSRARRVIAELPVFFPRWREIQVVRAITAEVYWVRGEGEQLADLGARMREALACEVLEDPLFKVNDRHSFFPPKASKGRRWWCLEKQLRAGVTDNAGHAAAEALTLVMGSQGDLNANYECRSGLRLWLELPSEISAADLEAYASEVFYNALIERVEFWSEDDAREADAGLFAAPRWLEVQGGEAFEAVAANIERFDVATLSIGRLEQLSRERLWALSKEELECVQAHYRGLGRETTDVEIEVIAQTWSEHCKHKIFAADIEVRNDREDVELPARVQSVFKTYIRGATREIPASYLKSVFEDNAGVINISTEFDCAIKVETHNSPSALDPYGGALTGIVGVNRDILGVGLGAHPIANLDVFCVGPLDAPEKLPPRLHHPRRILEGVRVGVEHGGNKSGIPTVTGAVVHHHGYLGKPLVFCGTVGLLPADKPYIEKSIKPNDKIVMAGGRIGKDGIHGATFSSLEMNEDSPVSAVQLGDPLTQRRVWDFLIEARDQGLFRAVTDNGAGGLSSSIGELARLCGAKGGARMDVALAATKYPGLKPFELVVSESQERMSFAVDPKKLDAFLELAARRGVECSVLGEFEDSGRFHILFSGETVGELDMHFLHEGLPPMRLKARVAKPAVKSGTRRYGAWNTVAKIDSMSLHEALPAVLAHPNVCSRRSITRQYDHEVQARSVRKPYGSPGHSAPGDGATLRLSRVTHEGIALGLGLAPFAADIDAKVAAELALDEALRNAAVAGMDPSHAALVDNFCWPDPLPGPNSRDADEAERKLGALVVTCKRIYDGAVALRMPFISGKDSMKNDYRMDGLQISVPPTLLVTAMGKVHDVRKVPRGFALGSGRRVLWVSAQEVVPDALGLPRVDFERTYGFLGIFHQLIRNGAIESAHDVSDGGWLVATAEMLLGSGIGASLDLRIDDHRTGEPEWAALFGEPATSFVLFARDEHVDEIKTQLGEYLVLDVGTTIASIDGGRPRFEVKVGAKSNKALSAEWEVAELERAYHRMDHAMTCSAGGGT